MQGQVAEGYRAGTCFTFHSGRGGLSPMDPIPPPLDPLPPLAGPRATARAWGTSTSSRRNGQSTSATLSAKACTPKTSGPAAYVPRQPAAPHGFLPEVAFSDDHHHFALTGWGLAWLMGICAVTCAAACGSVQVGKPKVYHLVLRNRRLHYSPGTLPTPLGLLPL